MCLCMCAVLSIVLALGGPREGLIEINMLGACCVFLAPWRSCDSIVTFAAPFLHLGLTFNVSGPWGLICLILGLHLGTLGMNLFVF